MGNFLDPIVQWFATPIRTWIVGIQMALESGNFWTVVEAAVSPGVILLTIAIAVLLWVKLFCHVNGGVSARVNKFDALVVLSALLVGLSFETFLVSGIDRQIAVPLSRILRLAYNLAFIYLASYLLARRVV